MTAWVLAGVLCGLGSGLVSSLLGVVGGEVIIPTLVLAYGADTKAAGTASLLVSLPTVAVGVSRYARRGSFDRQSFAATVTPMGAGSVVGAAIRGILVGSVAAAILKILLGIVLIASAIRMFRHGRRS